MRGMPWVAMVALAALAAALAGPAAALSPGDRVCVYGTLGAGLRVHSGPCDTDPVAFTALEGDGFVMTDVPQAACGYEWAPVSADDGRAGWAATKFLQACGGPAWNVFGAGLVSEGDASQWDYTSELAGNGGWILLIFAGVDASSSAPQQSWVDAVNGAYARGLQPVVRLSPPWGQEHYRDESDDAAHRNYTTLAAAFQSVVRGLPLADGQNLYVQVHNEPDLCPEWWCAAAADPYSYTEQAAEYASFLSYVADAIHALQEPRLRVSLGALAPGGNAQCGCCGAQNCPDDNPGITGLQFMAAMMQAVPGVFNKVDFLASHSYPASGIGFGFGVPFDEAQPGLLYYQQELKQIQRSCQVVITETGWGTNADGQPPCSQEQKATWTTQAYALWRNDTRVMGVTPFMLQDAYWGDQKGYGYVSEAQQPYPVFPAVQSQRCSLGFAGAPC